MRIAGWVILLVGALAVVAGSGGALAADPPELAPGPAPILFRALPGTGSTRVVLEDLSSTPFASPLVRLVPVPAGVVAPTLDLRDVPEDCPVEIRAGRPMTLRGLRVVPVIVSPTPVKSPAAAAAGGAPRALEFALRHGEEGSVAGRAAACRTDAARYSRGFLRPYAGLLPDEVVAQADGTEEGGYLVVTAPTLVSAIEPLVAWKREMGFPVTVVTTDVTGIDNDQIREYIRSFYQNAAVPPQYVLLAGDVEQVASFDLGGSVGDLPYELVDGEDFLPDVEVGRLSAQTSQQMETIVAKILGYERDPYRGGGDGWFRSALMVAGNYGSETPVPLARWSRQLLLSPEVGCTVVDTVYYPIHWGTGTTLIRNSVNRGVALVSYRGWAYNWAGWEPPKFTVEDIPSLANGWKLPAVFSFVCLTGAFAEPECFGEAWLRAGTATSPKGGVAFIGNSEHWSHTRYNDAAAIGAFAAIHDRSARRLGEILVSAKSEILREFPDMMDYATYGEESVEFYYHIYSLLGDPGMEIWLTVPRTVQVSHPDTLPRGSTSFCAQVYEADGVTPVVGARVGLCQGGTVLGSARTNSAGEACFPAAFEETGSPVKVTVTGTGISPYRDSLAVVEGGPFVAYRGLALTDDGSGASAGNGDGVANPGETLELRVSLQNLGAAAATGVHLHLASPPGVSEVVGTVYLPDLAPGETAEGADPLVITLDASAEDGRVFPFQLTVGTDGGAYEAAFDLATTAPVLRFASATVGGDGVLDPGETASLTVSVLSEGSVGASASTGVLRSATPGLATVLDSVSAFTAAAVGLEAAQATPFTVQVTDTAAVGQAAVFTLVLTTAEGYELETSFSVVVGNVDHRAPLGPDGYGYYAYDNSDTDYPDAAPLYEWVPCSTVYGGTGTRLSLNDTLGAKVRLPFSFVFYGVSYDSLLVSDNGYASFDLRHYYDFYNWTLPSPYGFGARLAPFWDNLDVTKSYEGTPVGDGVYVMSDTLNHRFVIEWSRLGNKRSQHEPRLDLDDLQTFELILFDPAHYSTPTGDGIIRFQYKQVVNNDTDRMYSTVGIENEDRDAGLQYSYSNEYPAAAAPLSAGLAIDFTTRPPRYDPFGLARFAATRADGGVALAWEPADDRPRAGYRVYRAAEGGEYRLVTGGALGPEARGFLDRGADPGSACIYGIGSVDPAGRETILGPFAYDGGAAQATALRLEAAGAVPSAGPSLLRFSLPERMRVRLQVYGVTGRRVRTLVDEERGAGVWTVSWDGTDEEGRRMPAGIYFGRLEAGAAQRTVKITVLR